MLSVKFFLLCRFTICFMSFLSILLLSLYSTRQDKSIKMRKLQCVIFWFFWNSFLFQVSFTKPLEVHYVVFDNLVDQESEFKRTHWESEDPEQGEHFQGDILGNLPSAKQGIISKDSRWPNATLVYEISESFNETEKAHIQHAMDEISSKTCIKFRERNDEDEDFVNITKPEKGCSSHVGKQDGVQLIKLSSKCFNITKINPYGHGKAAHELIHSLGFKHEHARPDRDEYIAITWDKIDHEHASNFDKADPKEYTTFAVPYDFNSIMHYPKNSFLKKGAKGDTISPRNGKYLSEETLFIGQRRGLSNIDFEKLNRMYECNIM